MAWYDFFTPNSIAKHARRIGERDAQAEDRQASAAWLSEQATPESLLALCLRFDLQLDHNLKDRTEKDQVIELLVEHGPAGAEAAKQHAHRSANFQHLLTVVTKIEGASAGTALLLDLLAKESVDNEFKPEKKRNVLMTLAERRDERIIAAATPFLADFDEGVRHAAIEAIAAQGSDAAREPLWGALAAPKEESTRIRGRLAEVFFQRHWAVPNDAWFASHLPPGYAIGGGEAAQYLVAQR
jgi:hypothetical protein